jgi:hypothetical protein
LESLVCQMQSPAQDARFRDYHQWSIATVSSSSAPKWRDGAATGVAIPKAISCPTTVLRSKSPSAIGSGDPRGASVLDASSTLVDAERRARAAQNARERASDSMAQPHESAEQRARSAQIAPRSTENNAPIRRYGCWVESPSRSERDMLFDRPDLDRSLSTCRTLLEAAWPARSPLANAGLVL